MKNIKSILIALILIVIISSCADKKTINGITYEPYGIANMETKKVDSVVYEIPAANWIVGVICCPSILIPGYIIGWDLFEPVSLKTKK